ncbi:MAG: hypothetical protein M1812_003099 [Candelaria pacifica]|nr:MAG: hypothetical protein M1812_003099 [Candelaria pacifica]
MVELGATQSRPSIFKSSSTLRESFVHSVREWRNHEKASRDDVATDSSILSIFPGVQHGSIQPAQLLFYRWWLDQQLGVLPAAFLTLLPGTAQTLDFGACSPLTEIFLSIAGYIKTERVPVIDNIIEQLRTVGLLRVVSNSEGRSEDIQQLCRSLVFAILGWQTMLYQASFGTCPPQQLAIVDDLDGYRGQAFMELRQEQDCAKRQLKTFLMGFGVLLAPKNMCISDFPEECQAFESVTVVGPEEINFFLLQSIAHVKIKWIDVLAPHLEYDKSTNTLFLFRYPSFCTASLPCRHDEEAISRGVIHRSVSTCCIMNESDIAKSCATQGDDTSGASEGEITDFLREVLLSYRLLFGQSKDTRNLFRTMDPFEDVASEGRDDLLMRLCGRKSVDTSAFGKERSAYHLPQHFPILRFKIAVLKAQLSVSKAKGWRELWRDRRDSTNWYTFWAVLIIGGVGILLSFLQVLVGITQIVITVRPRESSQ